METAKLGPTIDELIRELSTPVPSQPIEPHSERRTSIGGVFLLAFGLIGLGIGISYFLTRPDSGQVAAIQTPSALEQRVAAPPTYTPAPPTPTYTPVPPPIPAPTYAPVGRVYKSLQGDAYNAKWDGNRLWQPQLPPGPNRVAHEVAITIPPGQYAFDGVECAFHLDELRNGRGASNPVTVSYGNDLRFKVSTDDRGEALGLVKCRGNTSSGFQIRYLGLVMEMPPTNTPVPPPPQRRLSFYDDTKVGMTKQWSIPVEPDKTLIVGGYSVNGVSGGVYQAIPGGQSVNVSVTDGFVLTIINYWARDEFCFRLSQAKQFGWAHSVEQPLQGWQPCQ